jgi:hypothetical protein
MCAPCDDVQEDSFSGASILLRDDVPLSSYNRVACLPHLLGLAACTAEEQHTYRTARLLLDVSNSMFASGLAFIYRNMATNPIHAYSSNVSIFRAPVAAHICEFGPGSMLFESSPMMEQYYTVGVLYFRTLLPAWERRTEADAALHIPRLAAHHE